MKYLLLIITLLSLNGHATADDTLAKVKNTGFITMGVRDSSGSLSYAIGDGRYAGFHVELCQRIITNLEKIVGRKIELQYQLVTSQNRIPLLKNGTVDIECGSTTNNATRQRDVSFLVTTYVQETRVAVKTNSGIDSINQLNGRTVASTSGSTEVQMLRKLERSTDIDFKEVFGKDHAESFLLLDSGRADALVADSQVLSSNIALSKSPKDYKILNVNLSVEPLAIMIRKDDIDFKKLADDTVIGLAKSGELGKLYDKWFMQPIPPKGIRVGLPASESTNAAWATPNDKPAEEYARR